MIFNEKVAVRENAAELMTKVYFYMMIALIITTLSALFMIANPNLMGAVFGNRILFYGILIVEVGLVIFLSSQIDKINFFGAALGFAVYSALTGVTMSVIFIIYKPQTIALAFAVTAGTFAVMSIYGYFTKQDLTAIGNLFLMLLVGVIIGTIVNIFLKNSMFDMIITYITLIVFIGLTAYDTQKIKNAAESSIWYGDTKGKVALMGSLTLYLDFINLFLTIVKLLGKRN